MKKEETKTRSGIRIKTLLMLMTMFIMLFGSTLTVFAGEDEDIQKIQDSIQEVNYADLKSSIKSKLITEDKSGDDNYSSCTDAGGTTYYFKKSDASTIVSSMGATGATGDEDANSVANNLKTVFDKVKPGGATGTFIDAIEGFLPVINVFLSGLVIIITAAMTVFSALDIAFIAFPTFRNKCDELKANGGTGTKTDSSGGVKLRFITDEAVYAVEQAQAMTTGKNPFAIYFSKRIVSYLLLAVMIFILLTGKITLFTDLALRLMSGILNIISGF